MNSKEGNSTWRLRALTSSRLLIACMVTLSLVLSGLATAAHAQPQVPVLTAVQAPSEGYNQVPYSLNQTSNKELGTSVAKAKIIAVAKGDWLSKIVGRVCGNANLWPSVARQNNLSNPDLIFPGQRLSVTCVRSSGDKATRSVARTAPSAQPKVISSRGWVHPLTNGAKGNRAYGCWGASRDGGNRSHKGTDLGAGYGSKIRAVASGKVIAKRYSVGKGGLGAGYYVVIQHKDGIRSVYMHMKAHSFKAIGERVSAGQTIGYVGSSGATSSHLHFEIHKGAWNPVNSASFMRARGVSIGC